MTTTTTIYYTVTWDLFKWPELGQFLGYNLQIYHGDRSTWYLQDDDDVDDDDDDNDDK